MMVAHLIIHVTAALLLIGWGLSLAIKRIRR